ncbi:uncharacterized protein LOC135631027 [Musa acuminata AAA Group]|uniref:Uncharacterized protein n=1 Tax=Musa acuminata subsp. malaccensis TaxID=214687 RepID=A0A804IG64_MUSAM|nr:PREDICTED: uncharacterized protein LOC103978942 [Musa acuminata subsp. malaccensis]XP_009393187.1 PREDICTED: uncharacterized protein LOC103978942 [Musa acuminata subsp. malaccensis]XP_009393189.1 PREDICTED: uncharacterized protein LOC103978942 [Musa acuminata subsp. malaccensis]
MSTSSPYDEEHTGTNDGGMEFPAIGDGHFVFEDKNLVFHEDDQVQQELEVQLGEDGQSNVSATVLWKHVVKGKKCGNAHGGSHVFKCKYCHKIYHGTYTRVYAHLMGHKKGESKGIGYCSVVKADKNLQMQIKREVEQVESTPNVVPLKKSKLNACSVATSQGPSLALSYVSPFEQDYSTQDRDDVDSKVVRCLCANGIPFNVLRSPYWEEMVLAISKELGYKSPSYEKANTIFLENERNKIDRELDDFKQKWPLYGISIVSNGWSDIKNQPLINILASNQFGSMFLHALDFVVVEKSQKRISDYMVETIEKVGPCNVVQLITDNSIDCRAASEEVAKVYPYIFWNPCMVHTLYLILKDIINALPWLKQTYKTAKSIVKYILYHSQAVDIFQSFSKLELLKVTAITYASHYITLYLLLDIRESLTAAVLSDRWEFWATFPNIDEKIKLHGNDVKEAVMSENFWVAVQLALSIIRPIYKMIKFTDQDGPIIGEVCDRMDNMLGEIRENLRGREDMYMILEEKVFIRWNKRNVPLQCLAYALTPKYYDEEYLQIPAPGGRKRCPPDQDDEIFDSAVAAICKMHPNVDHQDIVRVQFLSFVEKKGKFSSPVAKRDARNPKINVLQWWKFHGGDTKELRDVAFKVLSQSISSLSVDRPWSTYSYIRGAKRHELNSHRADDLAYVHSNLRLLSRFSSSYKYGPHRKWDVNPELPLVDESALQWEDLCFMGLDDDDALLKQASHSSIPIQELLRIIEDVPSSNNQNGEQSQITSSVRTGGVRGGQAGITSRIDPKGKTKKFL